MVHIMDGWKDSDCQPAAVCHLELSQNVVAAAGVFRTHTNTDQHCEQNIQHFASIFTSNPRFSSALHKLSDLVQSIQKMNHGVLGTWVLVLVPKLFTSSTYHLILQKHGKDTGDATASHIPILHLEKLSRSLLSGNIRSVVWQESFTRNGSQGKKTTTGLYNKEVIMKRKTSFVLE
jgi:hypothetical protein